MGSADSQCLIEKDDLLLDGVLHETGFVVDIGLMHQIELVSCISACMSFGSVTHTDVRSQLRVR